jgi:hypothetical protein
MMQCLQWLSLALLAVACVSGFQLPSAVQPRTAWTGAAVTSTSRTNNKVAPRLAMELDQATVIGLAAGFGGLAFGAGLVAFTERQGVKTAERGLDEGMANKLQAKLLEDFELDDAVSRVMMITSLL